MTLAITTTSGPELDVANLSTLIDTTASSVSTLPYDANFSWTGPGGYSLVGTYSLVTDGFASAVNDSFTGILDATGGTGAVVGYIGFGNILRRQRLYRCDGGERYHHDLCHRRSDIVAPEPLTLAVYGLATAVLS